MLGMSTAIVVSGTLCWGAAAAKPPADDAGKKNANKAGTTENDSGDLEKPEKTETDLWVLTYIHSEVHSTAPASTPDASTTPDPIDTLVDVLNSIYSSDSAPVVQRAGLGRLLLTGPRSKVLEVQHFLALIDAPLPQVQLNMWAIQVSGAPKDISPTLHNIGKEVRAARDRMAAVQQELARIVVLSNPEETGHWQDLKERFEAAGIEVGRTRVVVTSGLEAGLEPQMASFVESGRPKPFGKDLLDAAFPSSKAGEGTKKDVLTGTSQVLAGLSNAQAIGLAALLASDIQPACTKVAPGIAVNVRPTVLPDGGAARLTVDARFGVASTPPPLLRAGVRAAREDKDRMPRRSG
jgi:hypothetical protein